VGPPSQELDLVTREMDLPSLRQTVHLSLSGLAVEVPCYADSVQKVRVRFLPTLIKTETQTRAQVRKILMETSLVSKIQILVVACRKIPTE